MLGFPMRPTLLSRCLRAGLFRLGHIGRRLGQAGYLMVGMPDYQTYVEHMRRCHPDRIVMSYPEFFRDRQQARYGGGKDGKGRPVRCC